MKWTNHNYHLAGNLKQVLDNRSKRSEYTFRILPDGSSYYFKGSEMLTQKQIDEKYPITIEKPKPCTESPDKRYIWMNGGKSY